jgi:hypothetical protein
MSVEPEHYLADNNNDVIRFCMDNHLSFAEGNVCKYVVRYKQKNGLEDLQKARMYLDRLISNEKVRQAHEQHQSS